MDERDKLFKELRDRKAGCIEMAWNGFVNLYIDGEPPCKCVDCKKEKEIENG